MNEKLKQIIQPYKGKIIMNFNWIILGMLS